MASKKPKAVEHSKMGAEVEAINEMVKPQREPREGWAVAFDPTHESKGFFIGIWMTEHMARDVARRNGGSRAFKVREVME